MSFDFATTQHHSIQKIISVEGEKTVEQQFNKATLQDFQGYVVNMVPLQPLKEEEQVEIEFHIGSSNGPIIDLEAYLGAPMHFAIVKEDFSEFIHSHGSIPGKNDGMQMHDGSHTTHAPNQFGPTISLLTSFPSAGTYHIFGEFKHRGEIIEIHHIVDVKAANLTV